MAGTAGIRRCCGLLTRPRRFEKTLNMDIVESFSAEYGGAGKADLEDTMRCWCRKVRVIML